MPCDAAKMSQKLLYFCSKLLYIFVTNREGLVTKSLIESIKDRIADNGPGWCFTQDHFRDLGNYNAVRQTLSRLNNIGFIQRLGPGLYHSPRYHDDIGELPPKIENVIKWSDLVEHW